MACQDQVCFCPFKAKKPRGTFPKEREREGGKPKRREGPLEEAERKERGSLLVNLMVLKVHVGSDVF